MAKIPKLFVLSAVLLLAVSCNYFTPTKPATEPEAVSPENTVKIFSYQGIEGVDALTTLKELYQVETKDFGPGLGEFVQSINGVKPASNEFWAFYVNGESSNVGASSYVAQANDQIEWRMEKIKE
ncbi:MAG: DUF4430 domain-containing protein [Candidatus Doudnabacteria bacterium]|nr:DUF4430 domain-containing protein [Candidatus Doudnabacteria bacterium]